MKTKLISLLFLVFSAISFAQYGSVELNTGGFSPVPAFSDSKPNLIVAAGTNTAKTVSAHIIGNVRIEGTYVRSMIFMTRFKLVDKKFKLHFATHLPVLQVDEDFHTDTFFAQELAASYSASDKSTFGLHAVRGRGLNNDLGILLVGLSHNYHSGKLNFNTQIYGVDFEHTWGIVERINYDFSKTVYATAFFNKGIGSSPDIFNAGLGFRF